MSLITQTDRHIHTHRHTHTHAHTQNTHKTTKTDEAHTKKTYLLIYFSEGWWWGLRALTGDSTSREYSWDHWNAVSGCKLWPKVCWSFPSPGQWYRSMNRFRFASTPFLHQTDDDSANFMLLWKKTYNTMTPGYKNIFRLETWSGTVCPIFLES